MSRCLFFLVIASLLATSGRSTAETIEFSGHTWEVRPSGRGGPGPNQWDPRNVWLDGKGCLHLKLTQTNGRWSCAEVYTQESLGFGIYQFWLDGRIDRLDQNVVFGLFNYPSPELGPDKTHEIDIEFARWGDPALKNGNYTVWPTTTSRREAESTFEFQLNGNVSTHRFIWSSAAVVFQSLESHSDDSSGQFSGWSFRPAAPRSAIGQRPMPLHINLWCFKGRPPQNGQPVELVIRSFKFTPQ